MSRNGEVYRMLRCRDLDELKHYLVAIYPNTQYCVDYFVNFWVMAHQIYGNRAKDLQQPLWLVYLEAHGVEVKNRGEAIMKHRGRNAR